MPIFVLSLVSVIFAFEIFYKICPSVLSVDFMRDLGLNEARLPLISSATMLGYAIMQIPSGIIADAFGGRRVVLVLTLLVGASTLAFSLTENANTAIFLRFLTGIGTAVTVPCLTLLARWFPPQSFGRANSIMLMFGMLGTFLATGPAALAAQTIGWRVALGAIGTFSIVQAVFLMLVPEKGASDAGPDHSPNGKPEKNARPKLHLMSSLKTIAGKKDFWFLSVWFVCFIPLNIAFASLWWGPYLMKGCGMTQTGAGAVLSAVTICAFPMQVIVAWLSDSLLQSRKKIFIILGVLGVLTTPFFVRFCGSQSFILHTVLGVVFYYATGGGNAVAYAALREMIPGEMLGLGLGFMNTFYPIMTMALQTLFGHILLGRLAVMGETEAYAGAMWVYGAVMLLGLAAALLMRETFPGEKAAA